MYKILIVEDDDVIADVLERRFREWGHEARRTADFSDVLGFFVRFSPHLVLLDISLPFYNGFYWCGEIRKISRVPIVFITSAGDNMNLVMALSMGADDLIAKPFDLDVLTAKVQALLRRTYAFAGAGDVLEHRGAVLCMSDGTLSAGSRRIELTKNEFRIMQMLMENRGRTVSREALMNRLWESDSFIDDNTLTVNVNRLRRRLEEIGLAGFISTKKGQGYLLEEEKMESGHV